jgi:predicted kinase
MIMRSKTMEEVSRNVLIVFCGPSGAGKTTVARIVSEDLMSSFPTIHVQTDLMRKMFVKRSYSRSENYLVYSLLYDIARKFLPRNYNVILDGTFLYNSYRKRAIQIARYFRKRYLIVGLKANLATLIERNKSRSAEEYVPESTVTNFWIRFQHPINGIVIDTKLHSPEECAQIILQKLSTLQS